MGAPIGNDNAAGPHKRGWYRKSGGGKFLMKKVMRSPEPDYMEEMRSHNRHLRVDMIRRLKKALNPYGIKLRGQKEMKKYKNF